MEWRFISGQNCTSRAASPLVVNFNCPLTLTQPSPSYLLLNFNTPLLQTCPFTLPTISWGLVLTTVLSHIPVRLEGCLWQPAVITSVYLMSLLLLEPSSGPLLPLFISPRTWSLAPLGRSTFLGNPLWTMQKDTTKTERWPAHIHRQITNIYVQACQPCWRNSTVSVFILYSQ